MFLSRLRTRQLWKITFVRNSLILTVSARLGRMFRVNLVMLFPMRIASLFYNTTHHCAVVRLHKKLAAIFTHLLIFLQGRRIKKRERNDGSNDERCSLSLLLHEIDFFLVVHTTLTRCMYVLLVYSFAEEELITTKENRLSSLCPCVLSFVGTPDCMRIASLFYNTKHHCAVDRLHEEEGGRV